MLAMAAPRPDATPGDAPPSAEDEALLAIFVGAAWSAESLALVSGDSAARAEEITARLASEGCVDRRAGGRIALTEAGRAAAARVLERERAALGADAASAMDAFERLDARAKRAVTAWQVRALGSAEVANDHRDPAYDARVLADIATVVGEAIALLRPLAASRARHARFGERLERAMARARAGDHAFVSGVDVDSVHAIWWQIHGELLALAGRARGGS